MNTLRPFLSRFIAGWIASGAVYLESRYHFTLDADTQAGLLAFLLGSFSTVYVLFHRLIDKWVNPGDAASSHLADAEKKEAVALKTVAGYPPYKTR